MEAKEIYNKLAANGGWLGARLESELVKEAFKYPDIFYVDLGNKHTRSAHMGLVIVYIFPKRLRDEVKLRD